MSSESEPIHENDPTPNAQQKPDAQQAEDNPNMSGAASVSSPPPSKTHCDITCKTEKNFWDHIKTGAELIGIVLLAIYTAYTIKMYCANKKSADAAKSAADTAVSQLELAERPWLNASFDISGPFDWDVNGANIRLVWHIVNSGHSPALKTVVEAYPVDSNFVDGDENPIASRDLACQSATGMIQKFPYYGIAIFPNSPPVTQGAKVTISNQDIAKHHGKGSQTPGIISGPSVVVCIGYKSSFSPKVYHTSYIFSLIYADATTNLPRDDFKVGDNIPAVRLKLRPDFQNPVAAD